MLSAATILTQYSMETIQNQRFLINKETADIIHLNPIGQVFLDMLLADMSAAEICQEVSQTLSAPLTQIEADLSAFINNIQHPEPQPTPEINLGAIGWLEPTVYIAGKTSTVYKNQYYQVAGLTFAVSYPDSISHRLCHAVFQLMAVKPDCDPPTFSIFIEKGKNGYGFYLNNDLNEVCTKPAWMDVHLIKVIMDFIHVQIPNLLQLHAAAVTDNNGQAIIFAAPSGSGKSTLATWLALQGFHYLGDDTILVDINRREVIPFPTAANLKPGSWSLFNSDIPTLENAPIERQVIRPVKFAAAPFNSAALTSRYKIKALVLPHFDKISPGMLTALPANELILKLRKSRFIYYPEDVYLGTKQLIDFCLTVPGWELNYSDCKQALNLLHDIC